MRQKLNSLKGVCPIISAVKVTKLYRNIASYGGGVMVWGYFAASGPYVIM